MTNKKDILENLKKVIDPEIGENVVDLGFIREVKTSKDNVEIIMTLTTPFCPMAGNIVSDVKKSVEKMGIKKVDVKLDFEKPWSPEMMKDEVRIRLGFD